MANIFEIRVKKTKNLGNYESKTVEAAMQIEENEDTQLAMIQLEEYVNNSLHEVKPDKVVSVVEDGNVLTKNKEVKDPSSGKKVAKKKVAKKTTTKKKKEEIPVKKVTIDEITKGLQEVWKAKGKNIAKDILKSFGAEKISDLKEEQYMDVNLEVLKCLK